jgi:hypothetical protein
MGTRIRIKVMRFRNSVEARVPRRWAYVSVGLYRTVLMLTWRIFNAEITDSDPPFRRNSILNLSPSSAWSPNLFDSKMCIVQHWFLNCQIKCFFQSTIFINRNPKRGTSTYLFVSGSCAFYILYPFFSLKQGFRVVVSYPVGFVGIRMSCWIRIRVWNYTSIL